MATDTCNSVLLDTEAVARELGIAPVESARLLAKKRIAGTRIGSEGPWRVLPESVAQYVARGAADARLSEYNHGDWFDSSLSNSAEAFYGAVVNAAGAQVPSDDVMRSRFEQEKTSSLDIVVTSTGAVATVLSQDVPASIYTPVDDKGQSRFKRWADVYATETLRRVAKQIIQDQTLMGEPLDILYESPETFTAITTLAYAQAAQRRIVFSKTYVLAGGSFGEIPQSHRASFLFPLSNVFTLAAKQRLLDLAF